METLLIELFLRSKITMNQVKTKLFKFRYFCYFVTRVLTITPRNILIYVFRAMFGFCNFKATSYFIWKVGVHSLNLTLNFE